MLSVRNLLTESVKFLKACKYFFTAASLNPWGDPKKLKGGYALEMFFHDTTYYLPIPLRFLRSVEISGKSGAGGNAPFEAVPPCCCGCCELFAVWDCILFYLHQSREKIKKANIQHFSRKKKPCYIKDASKKRNYDFSPRQA